MVNKISSRDITFNAIVLDSESQSKLKSKYPGIFPKYYGHHVTINFGVNEIPENLGEKVNIRVFGYGHDEKAEAVMVEVLMKSSNKNPHITISTDKSVSPVYSNTLLENGYELLEEPFVLNGVVSSFINGRYETNRSKIL